MLLVVGSPSHLIHDILSREPMRPPATGTALILLALCSPQLAAQSHPFVFSLAPRASDAPTWTGFSDLAYGHHVFAAVGQENVEQRMGLQVALGSRLSVVAQGGWIYEGDDAPSQLSGQVELLADVVSSRSPTGAILTVGVGGMRDYTATGVGLGRLIAGWRWARSLLVANVRLEHPFNRGDSDQFRDALDLNTTLGFTHEMTPGVRLGVESVAEDLEGLVESDEAEGGAKVMIGPSLGLGRRDARLGLLISGGPVLRLSNSTMNSGGAIREVGQPGGFMIRTSLTYQW